MNREEVSREHQLRQEIDLIAAVTAQFEAAAGDLLTPSSARAREEVLELLGVNYVGPEMLGRLLYGDENKFQAVELDYVKLKEILNEPDEWESGSSKFETYALVFKPPISFLELRDRANKVASAQGKTPAYFNENWYKSDDFATRTPKTGSWELVRRETVPDSTSKRFDVQKALIASQPNLTPASLLALASLLVGQFLEYDIKLYNGQLRYGRTSARTNSGGPVDHGGMDPDGAIVDGADDAHVSVGLAVSCNLE